MLLIKYLLKILRCLNISERFFSGFLLLILRIHGYLIISFFKCWNMGLVRCASKLVKSRYLHSITNYTNVILKCTRVFTAWFDSKVRFATVSSSCIMVFFVWTTHPTLWNTSDLFRFLLHHDIVSEIHICKKTMKPAMVYKWTRVTLYIKRSLKCHKKWYALCGIFAHCFWHSL